MKLERLMILCYGFFVCFVAMALSIATLVTMVISLGQVERASKSADRSEISTAEGFASPTPETTRTLKSQAQQATPGPDIPARVNVPAGFVLDSAPEPSGDKSLGTSAEDLDSFVQSREAAAAGRSAEPHQVEGTSVPSGSTSGDVFDQIEAEQVRLERRLQLVPRDVQTELLRRGEELGRKKALAELSARVRPARYAAHLAVLLSSVAAFFFHWRWLQTRLDQFAEARTQVTA